MITNEREYRITKGWLERFEQARSGAEERNAHLPARARQALRDQYESQVEELRAEIAEYEALRTGQIAVIELDSLSQLPDALIRARAASGVSQESLATRLGLRKQQIQRYEATRYSGVNVDRLQEIADALGVKISERLVLPSSAGPSGPPGAVMKVGAATLAGLLARRGQTLDDLAEYLVLPTSVVLKLQRGQVDLTTVPEEVFIGISEFLEIDRSEGRTLVEPRTQLKRPVAARMRTRPEQERGGTPTEAMPKDRQLIPFPVAVATAPDRTDTHRQRWLPAAS